MSASNAPTPTSTSEFEAIVALAQASSDFKPLWNRFVKTRFYVSIVRQASALEREFQLHLTPQDDAQGSSIAVSEYRDKLVAPVGSELISLSGAEIVRRAPQGVGFRLLLSSKSLSVAAARVEWLRKALAASHEAAQKKPAASVELAKSAAIPATVPTTKTLSTPELSLSLQNTTTPQNALPQLQTPSNILTGGLLFGQKDEPSSEPPSAPPPEFSYQPFEITPAPPVAKKPAQFEASFLKTQHISHAGLGIALTIPSSWQQTSNDKLLKLTDPNTATLIEINGRRREGLTLETWMATRLPAVLQEMPFLTMTANSQPLKTRHDDGNITAAISEYRGRFHGDAEDSIYQICCVQTPKRLIAICIRASLTTFESQRALFAWILAGVQAYERAATESTTSNPVYTRSQRDAAPSMFSLSFEGRLGRLRFIVYSVFGMVPFFALAVILSLFLKNDIGLGIMLLALLLFFVMQLRPLALRMHDLNLSAKWLFLPFIISGVAGATQRPDLYLLGQAGYFLFHISLLLIPGSADDNSYGLPCPPNSTKIKVSAFILIALMLIGLGSYYRMVRNGDLGLTTGKSSESQKSGYGFTPKDQSFSINFPVMPSEEDQMAKMKAPGLKESYLYTSATKNQQHMVMRVAFLVAPPDKTTALDLFASNFVRSTGGELIESEKTFQNGYAARAIKIKLPTGSYQYFRVLFASKDLYVLGAQSRSDKKNASGVQDFFDSFQVN